MRIHEKYVCVWWGGLSLRGKQVCEEVIRKLWQALHAHTKTSTHPHKQINILLQISLAETARSTTDDKLKWHPFKCLRLQLPTLSVICQDRV